MSYKLEKPYTNEQKIRFIVDYNHKLGFKIEETETALFALDENEIMFEGSPIVDEEYSIKKQAEEQQRLATLKLTKREVFLALYKDKGITPAQIKAQIPSDEALIEFEYANEYYRGNPLVDMIGNLLGYTAEQLDYLFENKEFPIFNAE